MHFTSKTCFNTQQPSKHHVKVCTVKCQIQAPSKFLAAKFTVLWRSRLEEKSTKDQKWEIKTSVRFNEDEFYFRTKEGEPNVKNIPSNQVHDTVIVGDEVSFNATKEPSQTVTKLSSSVQEALKDPQWKEAMNNVATKFGY